MKTCIVGQPKMFWGKKCQTLQWSLSQKMSAHQFWRILPHGVLRQLLALQSDPMGHIMLPTSMGTCFNVSKRPQLFLLSRFGVLPKFWFLVMNLWKVHYWLPSYLKCQLINFALKPVLMKQFKHTLIWNEIFWIFQCLDMAITMKWQRA